MDADPLRTQFLGGGGAVQKLEQEVDLLGEFGGEPLSVAAGARCQSQGAHIVSNSQMSLKGGFKRKWE